MDYELPSSLSHVEAGRKNVSSDVLLRWFLALDIDLNHIVQDAIKGIDFNLIHEATDKGININEIIKEKLNNEQ